MVWLTVPPKRLLSPRLEMGPFFGLRQCIYAQCGLAPEARRNPAFFANRSAARFPRNILYDAVRTWSLLTSTHPDAGFEIRAYGLHRRVPRCAHMRRFGDRYRSK